MHNEVASKPNCSRRRGCVGRIAAAAPPRRGEQRHQGSHRGEPTDLGTAETLLRVEQIDKRKEKPAAADEQKVIQAQGPQIALRSDECIVQAGRKQDKLAGQSYARYGE